MAETRRSLAWSLFQIQTSRPHCFKGTLVLHVASCTTTSATTMFNVKSLFLIALAGFASLSAVDGKHGRGGDKKGERQSKGGRPRNFIMVC